MQRYLAFLIIFFLASACKTTDIKKKDGTVKSTLIGKNISNTPLREYVKKNIPGNELVILLVYGCHHCMDATKEMKKLYEAKTIDNIIILGSEAGETGSKNKFITTVLSPQNFEMIDYDWLTFPRKFTSPEPTFPQYPPIIFHIHNNVIKNIYHKTPTAQQLKLIK